MVVVCGVPGVGKSTVARAVARQLDASVLRTDVVRKELFAEPTYESSETETVYEEVFTRAASTLTSESVVLDGTFRTQARRRDAERLADQEGVSFRAVVVECDTATVRDRLQSREDDPSDADFEIHELIAQQFEPLTCAHDRVDNSGSLADTRQQVAELF